MPNKLNQFWQELKRRNVIYFLVGYLTACVAIIELSSNASDTFSISKETVKLLYMLSVAGIPVVILLPWYINRKKTEPKTDESRDRELNTKSDKPQIQDKSIIVLPFENISSDPEQEYFSDGLTEEIITDLSYINDLLVISRSSAMTFKGTKKKIKEIARDVNVRYVLEGSVRKSGNDLRIVAQLIDSSNDSHIWAEKYTGKTDDIFDIQERVSRSVADSLKLKLSDEEKSKIAEHPINNPLAYELYLKARREILKFTPEGLDNAVMYIQKGLDIVGENVQLLTGMGYVNYQYVNLGIKNDDTSLKRIEESSYKIFALEPHSPYGHIILGLYMILSKDARRGIFHFKKVILKYPNDFDALFWMCAITATLGKQEIALPLAEKLIKIDPLNEWVQIMPGFIDYWNGDFDKASTHFEKAKELFPDSFLLPFLQALLFAGNREIEKSCSIFRDLSASAPVTFAILFSKYNTALKGNIDEFNKTGSPEFQEWAWRDFQYCYFTAQVYAIANDKKEALKWLEHAVDIGMVNYPFISEKDPLLENIRSEPEFRKLIERVKHEWEDFEF